MQEELKEYEEKKKQIKGAIDANNYKLDESYVRQVEQCGDQMMQSVKRGAATQKDSDDDEDNGMKMMGCKKRREKKQKKRSLLSL